MKLIEATVKSLKLAATESDRIWFDDTVHGLVLTRNEHGNSIRTPTSPNVVRCVLRPSLY